jgi:Fe2+ or Zn2+ uptake regulation protein
VQAFLVGRKLKLRIKIHSPIIYRTNNSLKDFLYAKGFKTTKGRDIILKELETRGEHCNAESLYAGLSQKKQRVSRPTIYRTLKLLEKLRLIERFDIKKNCFYYEPLLNRGEHGHFICEECRKKEGGDKNGKCFHQVGKRQQRSP